MTKSLKLALSSLGALVLISLLETVELHEPLKALVAACLHHLNITCEGLVVGGFLMWIFEDAIAHRFGPIMTDGFTKIGEALAGKMVGDGSIGSELSKILREFAGSLTPAVRELAEKGKISEAVETLEKVAPEKKVTQWEEEVAVLLHSESKSDWERAVLLVAEHRLTSRYLLTVAYRFWTVGDITRAIEVAEDGLKETTPDDGAGILLSKFKNSLAYYYADGQRVDKEEIARNYALGARTERAEDPTPMDTLGYVLISFGKTREEITSGVELCYSAWKKTGDARILSKHIDRANRRLAAL